MKCNRLTDERLNNVIRPKIDGLSKSISGAKILIHEQDHLVIGFDIYTNIFSLCNKEILMIDFDYKEGITRKDIIARVSNFCDKMLKEGEEMLFAMYDTDRGVHAFLVNKYIHFASSEALKIMVDMCSDEMYIGYAEVRGFCVRLNPKTINIPENQLSKTIKNEFISKKFNDDFFIGYGNPDENIINVLDFHIACIKYFKDLYIKNLNDMITYQYIAEIDKMGKMPNKTIMNKIKNDIEDMLKFFDIYKEESKFETMLREDQKNNHVIEIYSNPDLKIGYDIKYGIWHMCTPSILMVDFDEKTMTKEEFIYHLKNYCNKMKNKIKYLFWIYESDRGIHAFLVNKYVYHNSKESYNILTSITPENTEHINFVSFGTHCVRIGPKLRDDEGNLKTKTNIINEIVEKKCFNNKCQVGYGTAIDYIEDVLNLKSDIISVIKTYFNNNFDEMIQPYKIQGINHTYYKPSDRMINKIRNSVIKLVDFYNLNYNDSTDFYAFKKSKLVNANRYADLFSNKEAESICSRRAIIAPPKRFGDKNIKDVRFLDNIPFDDLKNKARETTNLLELSCKEQIILLRGPIYPFILGFDTRMKLFYIMFYDLLMVDWDIIEGIPKSSPVKILERYINSQNLLPYNERVTKSNLCFKLYETDNGVHAYIVSHKMPFTSDKSSSVMINTCSDFLYSAFSRAYGYSIRLSPKIYNKNSSVKPKKEILTQYIQKEGINNSNKFVGDLNEIDPYLNNITDMIYDVQKYIMKIPNLYNKIINIDNNLLEEVRSYVVNKYNDIPNTYILNDNKDWSIGNRTCKYTNMSL